MNNIDMLGVDVETVRSALHNYPKKSWEMAPQINQSRHWKVFSEELSVILKSLRGKITSKKELFIPKASIESFEDKLYAKHDSGGFITSLVTLIDNNKKPMAMASILFRVNSSRGSCFITSSCDYIKGKRADKVFILKDHCVRRVIERSPVKDFSKSTAYIMWSLFKGVYEEHPVDYSYSFLRDGSIAVASAIPISFTTKYGKLLGTCVRVDGVEITLINTYVNNDT